VGRPGADNTDGYSVADVNAGVSVQTIRVVVLGLMTILLAVNVGLRRRGLILAAFGVWIGASVITGQVIVNGTAGDPLVGGSWLIAGPQLDSSPQEIDGNLVLTGNQVPIYVFDNHIRQNLVCEGNNPAPFTSLSGFGNTVDGRSVGQCAAANPATGAGASAALAAIAAG